VRSKQFVEFFSDAREPAVDLKSWRRPGVFQARCGKKSCRIQGGVTKAGGESSSCLRGGGLANRSGERRGWREWFLILLKAGHGGSGLVGGRSARGGKTES